MSLGVGVIERILKGNRGWGWSCVSVYPLSMGLEIGLGLDRINRLSTSIDPRWFIECSCESLGNGIR
jgi:hypothetical protein